MEYVGLAVVGCRGTCCRAAGPSAVLLFVAKVVPLVLIK
jgi:hypothetical protein